jgi:hypothetical protein
MGQAAEILVFLLMTSIILVIIVNFVVLVLGWCRLCVIDNRQRMRCGDGGAERAGRARLYDGRGCRVPSGGVVHLLSQNEARDAPKQKKCQEDAGGFEADIGL